MPHHAAAGQREKVSAGAIIEWTTPRLLEREVAEKAMGEGGLQAAARPEMKSAA